MPRNDIEEKQLEEQSLPGLTNYLYIFETISESDIDTSTSKAKRKTPPSTKAACKESTKTKQVFDTSTTKTTSTTPLADKSQLNNSNEVCVPAFKRLRKDTAYPLNSEPVGSGYQSSTFDQLKEEHSGAFKSQKIEENTLSLSSVEDASANTSIDLPVEVYSPNKRRDRFGYCRHTGGDSNPRLASLRPRKEKSVKKKQQQQKPTDTQLRALSTVPPYLDSIFLNKIDILEFDIRRNSNSCGGRKRGLNSPGNSKRRFLARRACSVLSITTKRKRASSVDTNQAIAAPATPPFITSAGVCAFASSTPHTLSNFTGKKSRRSNSGGVSAGGGGGGGTMSLYERRLQQSDDVRGIVTNGYLSSTRSSSANSGSGVVAMHTDQDVQDVANQYYISASSVGGSTSAISTLNNASNGSAIINHAPSMATLCNIGNSCYLNSVVYTLRFAPQFLHNLHHLIVDLGAIQHIERNRTKSSSLGRGVSVAHMENARSWSSKDLASLEQYNSSSPSSLSGSGGGGSATDKSSHQLLTEKLHDVYQSLHRNEMTESTEPFHTDTLLHAIQDVSAIFEGNQQQDAHEFLMCLLNSIRETCQTLIKAIAESPEVISNGYISNPDDLDGGNMGEKDAATSNNNTQSASGGNSVGGGNSSSSVTFSSLSTTNITKSSFFSRKSKRKDESKTSKNSRLQSPLKDSSGGAQQQSVANSLFYLNTVDLSGSSGGGGTKSSKANINPSPTDVSLVSTKGGTEIDVTPVNVLKSKERLSEKIRELGLDFFSEDFEGVTVSSTKCLSCDTVTEQKESMIDIAVPVPITGYDNSDYTDKPSSFIQNSCITREYFRGENKYRCEQCTGYTEAIRSISYEVLPRLLVIQLSRFSGGMEKINSYIPTAFTLNCFCSKCCRLSEGNKLHVYKLYSVITHVGATMSVGHYIAYTSSLDTGSEYVNCPKDRRTALSQQQQQQQMQLQQQQLLSGSGNNSSSNGTNSSTSLIGGDGGRSHFSQASAASAAASALASSSSSLIKKIKFVRSKASSSGDMSKNVKTLNGMTNKTITNGLGKMSINTTCQSLNCCAPQLATIQQQQQQQQQLQQSSNTSDYSEESSLQNGSSSGVSSASFNSFPSGYGSTGRGGSKQAYSTGLNAVSGSSNSEPIWYMCDDDKIKAMTQREFEELLSPTRKITVTPYLLFYARFNLQPNLPPTPKQPGPQSSWSNESLQSGTHKI